MLTVLTTKIWPSKARVREEYMASFMHIVMIDKVPQVVLWFSWVVHILGEIGTNVPHGLGTAEPPATAGPTGAAGSALWHDPGPEHLLSRGHNLDEQDQPRKHRFDPKVEARIIGSTCLGVQLPQSSFQGDPRLPWAKAVHHMERRWVDHT
jgi:hypothetical protein